jgi:hypothetical protein
MENAKRQRFVGLLSSSVNELGKCNLRYLHIDDGEMYESIFSDPCCTYPYLQHLKLDPFAYINMVPKGMTSLKNVVELCIVVMEFDKEGLHRLMGMPSLAHLELQIKGTNNEKLTVGINGFKLLKVFHVDCMTYGYFSQFAPQPWLTFAPGAVPALRRLHLKLNPMKEVASDFLAELGVEYLSGLAHLQVKINCYRAVLGRVEAVESSIGKQIDLHPNCETKIHVSRESEDYMYKDDKEWEEAPENEREDRSEYYNTMVG